MQHLTDKIENLHLDGSGNETLSNEQIHQLVIDLHNADPSIYHLACQNIRKILFEEIDPPIEQFVNANAIPPLVHLAQVGPNETKLEALCVLTNIAKGSNTISYVLKHGIINVAVMNLNSEFEDVSYQAVWLLGNIAGEGPTYRDLVIDSALPSLIQLALKPVMLDLARNIMRTFINCCRGKPLPDINKISSILPALAKYCTIEDRELKVNFLWCLYCLSHSSETIQKPIIDIYPVNKLVAHLQSDQKDLIIPSLRTIGNISTSDLNAYLVSTSEVALALNNFIKNPSRSIRNDTAWTFYNLFSAPHRDLNIYIASKSLELLISNLGVGEELEVRKEIYWCVVKFAWNANDNQLEYFVSIGGIPCLIDAMSLSGLETSSLRALRRVLSNTSPSFISTIPISDMISHYLNSDNPEISDITKSILELLASYETETCEGTPTIDYEVSSRECESGKYSVLTNDLDGSEVDGSIDSDGSIKPGGSVATWVASVSLIVLSLFITAYINQRK